MPWNILGSSIVGLSANDESGTSVSLNAAGNRLATGSKKNSDLIINQNRGCTRIYNFNGTTWSFLAEIDGEYAGDEDGHCVSLDSSGNKIAISSINSRDSTNFKSFAGRTKVYQYNGTSWSQIGQTIYGGNSGTYSGCSIYLSGDGFTLAVASCESNGRFGKVDVYEYYGSTWSKIGNSINSINPVAYDGYNIALNNDGSRIVIGHLPKNGGNYITTVYEKIYNETLGVYSWNNIGSPISTSPQMGCVSINSVGDIIAIGSPYDDGVFVYIQIENKWYNYGDSPIVPMPLINVPSTTGFSSKFGSSIKLNDAGDVIACYTPYFGILRGANYKANVQVFKLFNETEWKNIVTLYGPESENTYTNTPTIVSINSIGDRVAFGTNNNVTVTNFKGTVEALSGNFVTTTTTTTTTTRAPATTRSPTTTPAPSLVKKYVFNQLGSTIYGSPTEVFQDSIGITGDGSIIVIPSSSENSSEYNFVKTYKYVNGNWNKFTPDIITPGDSALYVAINNAGNVLAVGAPNYSAGGINERGITSIYALSTYQNNYAWVKFSADIIGNSILAGVGFSLSFNYSGDIFVTGSFGDEGFNGSVSVFIYNAGTNTWNLYGQKIIGNLSIGSRVGESVTINGIGNIIAFSSDLLNIGGTIFVYELINGTWQQKGQDIFKDNSWNDLGGSFGARGLSLNRDGDILAIADPSTDRVFVVKYNGVIWEQMGPTISSNKLGEFFGYKINLSEDGYTLLITAVEGFVGNQRPGYVNAYSFIDGDWIQIADTIPGKFNNFLLGSSLNPSSDKLVVGGYSQDPPYNSYFEVYEKQLPVTTTFNPINQISNYSDVLISDDVYSISEKLSSIYNFNKFSIPINGKSIGERLGTSVAINSNGNRIVAGASRGLKPVLDSSVRTGVARVYNWNGTSWSTLGQDIYGVSQNDSFGHAVAINHDGDIIAIGAPFVDSDTLQDVGSVIAYIFNESIGRWDQLGQTISGLNVGDQTGYSLSFDAEGDILAIGEPGSGSGRTRTFELSTNGFDYLWKQKGQTLTGEFAGDKSGTDVYLNHNGDILAVGGPFNDDNEIDSGHVRIYGWDYGDNMWKQLGTDINGESGQSGTSISLDGTGYIVAIGATFNSDNDNYRSFAGHVRIYKWDAEISDWIQLGNDIDGEFSNDYSGWSVSLNAAGNVVAISSPYNSTTGTFAGVVKVYNWDSNKSDWVKIRNDIFGESAFSFFGYAVSLNYSGSIVAIGAPWYNNEFGSVNIYKGSLSAIDVTAVELPVLPTTSTTPAPIFYNKVGQTINGELFPDQCGYSVSLNEDGDIMAIGSPFNDNKGGNNSGHTRIYKMDKFLFNWFKLGSDIDGLKSNANSGKSVSLNAAGNIIAIGAPNHENGTGYTQTLIWNGVDWQSHGQTLYGGYINGEFGTSVSLNSAGDILAIGSPFNIDRSDQASGYVHIYKFKNVDIPIEPFFIDARINILIDVSESMSYTKTILDDMINKNILKNKLLPFFRNDEKLYNECVKVIYVGERTYYNIQYEFGNLYSIKYGFDPAIWPRYKSGNEDTLINILFQDESVQSYKRFSGEADTYNNTNNKNFVFDIESLKYRFNSDLVIKPKNFHGIIFQVERNIVTLDNISLFTSEKDKSIVRSVARDRRAQDLEGDIILDVDDFKKFLQKVKSGFDEFSSSELNLKDLPQIKHIYDIPPLNTPEYYADLIVRNVISVIDNKITPNAGTWERLGEILVGENLGDRSGYSVSLNAAGDRIAIGAPNNNDNGPASGHVRIYDWNKTLLKWVQFGQDIIGESAYDRSGWSVSLNYDGTKVAIGSPYNDGRGQSAGHSRVYEFDSSTSRWIKVGQDINGENPGDQSGFSVSLDASGNRIAIGAPFNIGNSKRNSGSTRIYTWNSRLRNWIPIAGFVGGESPEDMSGYSVSLNSPGDAVAIGAIHRELFDTGYARMYQVDTKENYNRFTTSTTPAINPITGIRPVVGYIPPTTIKPTDITAPQEVQLTTKQVVSPPRRIITDVASYPLSNDIIDVTTTTVTTTVTTTTTITTTTTQKPTINCIPDCNKLNY